MTTPGQPLQLPDVRAFIGGPVDAVDELLNYGYRAAWRVRSGGRSFAVKCDLRPGFQENELRAHENAKTVGVPVPEIIGFAPAPIPALVLQWVEAVSLCDAGTEDSWRQAGVMLARAHSAPLLREPHRAWSDFILSWFVTELPYLVEHRGLSGKKAERTLKRATDLRPSLDAAPTVWLHGDCQPDHFLVDPKSRDIVGVIDWADAQPGDPLMDLAVLTMAGEEMLDQLLLGYGASAELRERARLLLPIYRTARAAGAARWLDTHGYPRVEWPLETVREFARG